MIAAPHLKELSENFGLFDNWEERYRYLIDLGRAMPALPEILKTEENLVRGCTSRVWMVGGLDTGRFLKFQADSDAHIVRGLIALLVSAYHGQQADEIARIDIEGFFKSIGLDSHLSPSRRNGFFAMVERIKGLARV
jgi:cysteine desulfuration protein SufE